MGRWGGGEVASPLFFFFRFETLCSSSRSVFVLVDLVCACTGRSYAVRRVREGFRQGKAEANPDTVQKLLGQAKNDFEMMKRQVSMSSCM